MGSDLSVPDHCLSFYFDFDIFNFPFLLRWGCSSCCILWVYISQLIRFARASSHHITKIASLTLQR